MDQRPAHDIIAPAVEAAQSVDRPLRQEDQRGVDDAAMFAIRSRSGDKRARVGRNQRGRRPTSRIDRNRECTRTKWRLPTCAICGRGRLAGGRGRGVIAVVDQRDRHSPALWLIAVLPTLDVAAVRREIMTPAGGLPVLLWAFGRSACCGRTSSGASAWPGSARFTSCWLSRCCSRSSGDPGGGCGSSWAFWLHRPCCCCSRGDWPSSRV